MEYPSLDKPKAGAFRFNTDTSQLEIYDGNQWVGVLATSPEMETGGCRGIIAGHSGYSRIMDYFNINSAGNAQDFGDISQPTEYPASGNGASRTRGIVAGGRHPGANYTNLIDYFPIASLGNATNFGDISVNRHFAGIVSDGNRAVIGGGYDGSNNVNTIDYITISSTGNANDFGDTAGVSSDHGAFGSHTRGVFGGANESTQLQYITIATQGNTADFGDLNNAVSQSGAGSNAVRGIISGGRAPSVRNVIEYVTTATLGNATDFGDLTAPRRNAGVVASSIRLCTAGGYASPTEVTTIDYVNIMTTGNAKDFGGLVSARYACTSGNSNGHGGL